MNLADDVPVTSVTANARFAGGAYSRGFQIGSRGYHEFVREHVLNASQRDRFMVKGRETFVASTADEDTTLVTLRDRYHELMTVFAGPPPNRRTLIRLFSTLEITDHPRGMQVRPEPFTQKDTALEQFAVTVADRATLTVPGPRQAHKIVPKHRGKRTKHGELWRVPLHEEADPKNGQDYLYVFAGAKGAAEIRLAEDAGFDNSAFMDWLEKFDVTWSHGLEP